MDNNSNPPTDAPTAAATVSPAEKPAGCCFGALDGLPNNDKEISDNHRQAKKQKQTGSWTVSLLEQLEEICLVANKQAIAMA